MKYWLMTDLHLGHTDKMVELCQRPTNYEELLYNGMKNISEKDCLIFLGDYCMGNDELHHQSHIMKFNFKKIMVKGNHDRKSYSWYLNHGWDFVCESFEFNMFGKKILFSHKPIKDNGYDFNIHGHFHNSDHHDKEFSDIRNDKHILIMMEHEYKPINLEKLINRELINNNC